MNIARGNVWEMNYHDPLESTKKIFGILVLIALLTLPLVTASLTAVLILHSGGTITTDIIAESGSPADIQDAVNIAVEIGGGVVRIPAGTFTWSNTEVTIPWGAHDLTIAGAGIDQTILKQDSNYGYYSQMFRSSGTYSDLNVQSSNIRICDMTLQGYVVSDLNNEPVGISIGWTKDFRLDHLKLLDFAGGAIIVKDNAVDLNPSIDYPFYCTGVIDHCTFDMPYKAGANGHTYEDSGLASGYGVNVQGRDTGSTDHWEDLEDVLGKFDTVKNTVVYIEDCTFSRCRHAIASNQGAWYVARYNTATHPIPENYQLFDVHGQGYGSGGRGAEIYGNTGVGSLWTDPPTYASTGMEIRGGSCFVYDNTWTDVGQGVKLYDEYGTYEHRLIHDTYIWNNDVDTVTNLGGPVINVDYFLRAPTIADLGFAYTAYPYPHPLTNG